MHRKLYTMTWVALLGLALASLGLGRAGGIAFAKFAPQDLAETSSAPVTNADHGRVLSATPKPPTATPVPLDSGTIYHFEEGVGGNAPVHEIAPNGSGDRPLVGMTMSSTRPSRVLHNGQRWFLQIRDTGGGVPFFPDGRRRQDVLVLTEGISSPLQLTDNGAQCIEMNVGPVGFADWAPSAGGQIDGAVAWIGTLWADAGDGGSPCDTPAATGIFRAALTFDGSGNVTGLTAQPTGPEFVVPNPDAFTFRPDGQQAAYTTNRQLFLVPGSASPLNGGKWVAEPAWSPNGAKIAFHGNTEANIGGSYATFTINPDDSGLTLLAQGRRAKRSGQTSLLHYGVAWSPNGTHLIYTQREVSNLSTLSYEVHRMTASGGGNVVLPTVDGPMGSHDIGWGGN